MSFTDADDVQTICRDAVNEGLFPKISLEAFDEAVETLTDNELENFLQQLWDAI